MNNNRHEIIVTNLKNEETVHHSVILLKGQINSKPNTECQTDTIFLQTATFLKPFKLKNGSFKIVTELSPGPNVISLNYCCLQSEFQLNYAPRATKYSVLPLYIICEDHDGRFQAPDQRNTPDIACRKITLAAKLLQCMIAEKLHEANQGRKTFQLTSDCQVFHSSLNYLHARQMTQGELWQTLGRELVGSDLHRDERKFLAFLSCTRYSGADYREDFTHDDIVKITQAYVALGGGGLALFGTACLFTWPETISAVLDCFESATLIDRGLLMDDSCYRGTYGTCFSTTLGSVLHELCHSFDLGHTESGIMGRGFDDIYKVFVTAKAKESRLLDHLDNDIQFEEKLESGLLSERLSARPKMAVTRVKTLRDEDKTFWTKSCLVLLSYHRWLNNFDNSDYNSVKYSEGTKLVTSLKGLRVIELRADANEMVLQHWVFEGKILKYSFQLPLEACAAMSETFILLAEDNNGNILKQFVKNK